MWERDSVKGKRYNIRHISIYNTMIRRQPKLRKDQQGLLLSPEEAPILSDDLSEKTDDPRSSRSKKSGGWRSLLFGSSSNSRDGNSNATRSTGRAVSAGRSSSRKAGRKGTVSASRGHHQQVPAPDLVQASSSSSSGPERERPIRSSAPLRTRPERRDEQSQQRKPVPGPTPAPEAAPVAPSRPTLPEQSTQAIQRTLSHQTQTRQITKSASQSSEKSDRGKLLPSQSRSPMAPTGAVARVLKRPFGRETVRPQDQVVRK